ncbi:hypothetical protein HDU76_006629 [Blyttiomyces sp. JEL0837]|nr:hypothetical protein HDU76_006629 [Blyttiomyces sp. JEL0837]
MPPQPLPAFKGLSDKDIDPATKSSSPFKTFSWGNGNDSKLGHGGTEKLQSPLEILSMRGCDVLGLTCGLQHSIALVKSTISKTREPMSVSSTTRNQTTGDVYGWGSNFYGQAGFMSDEKQTSGAYFMDDLDIVEMPNAVESLCESLVLQEQMRRRAGSSEEGKVKKERLVTVTEQNVLSEGVVEVSSGDFGNVAVTADGRAWTWGAGVLGHGNEYYDSKPLEIQFFPSVKRRVITAQAKGAIAVALAQRTGEDNSVTDANEVYFWGYLPRPYKPVDNPKEQKESLANAYVKAVSPVLIVDALQTFASVARIDACRQGVIITGVRKDDGSSVMALYGDFGDFGGKDIMDAPSFPFFIEMDPIQNVYTGAADRLIDLEHVGIKAGQVKQVVVWGENGAVFTFNQETRQPTVTPFDLGSSTALEPVSHVSIGAMGMLVVFKSGETRFWSFDLAASESGFGQCPPGRIRGIRELIEKKGDGEIVIESGGIMSAIGWDHAMLSRRG